VIERMSGWRSPRERAVANLLAGYFTLTASACV